MLEHSSWPTSSEQLVGIQRQLGALEAKLWRPPATRLCIGGVFICFDITSPPRGTAGDPAWAAAAVIADGRLLASSSVAGVAGAPYEPGLLALRSGPLLEAAVRGLREKPDVLLVNATGHDHPRRAGLALHLGAVLGMPTVGVTHRPLGAVGAWPLDEAGASAPLLLEGEVVGAWLRTKGATRPLAVHAGWRTDAAVALEVTRRSLAAFRTPEPIRRARRIARTERARSVR